MARRRLIILGAGGFAEEVADLASEAGRSVHKLYYALERIRENLMLCVDRAMRKEGWDVR